MATHSSILAWRITWTEEPGGLKSMGLKRSDMIEQLSMHSLTGVEWKCLGFPFFHLPGDSRDCKSVLACHPTALALLINHVN